ncbi:MAG: PocR ligand-binding domain-containing protein, partial [Spirochaetia bacterium]|nr:PocR ligand-binding domain-containing protein [Spirochaetia bacterium]
MEALHAVPELAIQAFEKSTATSVTVHDLSDAWWPYLAPDRFEHTSPRCAAVKAGFQTACTHFDVEILRREIQRFPEGCVKECHAGLVEWVVPINEKGGLRAILFAGQRIRTEGLSLGLRDQRVSKDALSRNSFPESIDEADSRTTLELLRQLGARLYAWHGQMEV